MIVAACILATLNIVLLIWLLWVASNIRDDQLVIRTWIGIELGKKRVGANQPSLAEWLADNPDRPYRHDPPVGPGTET
jgi:hypothetical protein